MLWNGQSEKKPAEFCWKCGSRVRGEQHICMNCGAVRVAEERMPQLAIPANGWYEEPGAFEVPKRYKSSASRPIQDELEPPREQPQQEDAATATPAPFGELARQPTASESRRAALARWMRDMLRSDPEQPQGQA